MERTSRCRRWVACVAACAAAVVIAAACDGRISDADVQRATLILYGRVAADTGEPIPGARVNVSYHPLLCSVAARTSGSTTTGADGRYRMVFQAVAEDVGCVRLRVTANGFRADSLARTDREFRLVEPFDSAETNFTLRR